jgi:hypothetical protein
LKVKAQGVLNAARWIREQHGTAVLAEVLAQCSAASRATVEAGIAINWHPVEELIEMLHAAERRLGTGDGEVARAIGAAGARTNLGRPLFRAAFFVARPATLMNRIAAAWSKYNDEGTLVVHEFDNQHMVIELAGLQEPSWLFCCTITGWMEEVGRALKVGDPIVQHSMCRGRAGSRCIWRARFDEVE